MDRTSEGNHVFFEVGDGNNSYFSPRISINNNQWYHVVGYFDGSKIGIFVDSIDKGSTSFTGTMNLNDHDVTIGKNTYENDGEYWDGLIDEVRISDTARSPAWIKSSYYSENDSLVSYETEEVR